MGLNTQFPEWLQRSTEANRQAGAMLGQNILQGLRFQQGVKQQELENRNLAEIQDANLLLARSQATIARLRAQQEALASDDAVQANGAMAGALALSTELAQSPNGYNPGNRARLYSYVAQNPFLAKTPWFKGEEEKFSLAEEYQRKAELIDQDISGRAYLETVRGPRTSSAFATAAARAQAMADRGEIAPEEVSRKTEEIMQAENDTALMKNTKFSVESAAAAGMEGDLKELTALASANNGRIPTINENTTLKLADRAAVIDLTDSVLDKIDKFNQAYGANAFDAYVGPFDMPFDRALDVIRKRSGPKDLAALDIIQSFEDSRTGKIKATSGTAVSKQEQERLDRSIGTTLSRNFVPMLKTFNNNERASFSSVLSKFSDRIINEDFKRVAKGRTEQKPAPTAAPPAPSQPSGSPVTVNSQAEYDALPSGSKYVDSTGKVKTKR